MYTTPARVESSKRLDAVRASSLHTSEVRLPSDLATKRGVMAVADGDGRAGDDVFLHDLENRRAA